METLQAGQYDKELSSRIQQVKIVFLKRNRPLQFTVVNRRQYPVMLRR